jgi:hypothetical protein
MRDDGWLCTFNHSYRGEPTWLLYRDVGALLDMIRSIPEFGINEDIWEAISVSYDLAALSDASTRSVVTSIKALNRDTDKNAEYFDGPFTFGELLEDEELAAMFAASREEYGLPPVQFGADLDAAEAFLREMFEVQVWGSAEEVNTAE